MGKKVTTFLKIGVTIGGFAYIITKMDLSQILSTLVKTDWLLALMALAMITASLFLRAYRWQILLQGLGVTVKFKRLANLYFVGNFFNAFLLSGFGGDVMRVLEASRNVPTSIAAGTVLVDRLTGLLMLFVIGLLALPFRPPGFSPELTWMVAGVSMLGLAAGFLLLEGSLIRRFGRWLPKKLSPIGDGPIAQLLAAVQGCGWTAVLKALAISTLFNLLLVGWWWISVKSLGFDISYGYYLLVIPILSISQLVPSVSGLGVRENIAPFLFAPVGLLNEEAVAISFLVWFLMRISSLFGAPLYIASLWRQNRPDSTDPVPESTQG
jgi:uncharacterized membrane protein YbhN (UPF0104 family)